MATVSAWSTKPIQWNIFARELVHVLAAHGLRLGQLDDERIVYHPEKVARLQRSLNSPAHFPALNPEEMDRLQQIVGLSEEEMHRLRAALVATAVERTLMDRLDPQTALMAANDVFELCLAAMRAQATPRLATVRGGQTGDASDNEHAETEEFADLLDAAALALDAAHYATTLHTRHATAQEALRLYTQALSCLEAETPGNDDADEEERQTRHSRLEEAREGTALARAELLNPDLSQDIERSERR
jgi:hypothetical protein